MIGSGNMLESLNLRRSQATLASNIHSGIHLGLHVYTKLTDALVSLYEQQQQQETSSALDACPQETFVILYKL